MLQAHPGQCPICGPTVFLIEGLWLRESYRCARCRSVPRMRALVLVLQREVLGWRTGRVFESSPDGPSSDWISRHASDYVPSQYLEGVPSGTVVDGVRCEDLHALSLPSESVDLVITQDVFEHVLDPGTAWREVARVLKPGGVHLWTVPIYDGTVTRRRVDVDGTLLMEADWHGSPVGGRSLVVHEWGADVVDHADHAAGTVTERFTRQSRRYGIRGAMTDVLLSRKPHS